MTQNGSTFTYAWGIWNGCEVVDSSGVRRFGQQLTDFYLPYFYDAAISNILVPDGWTVVIDAGNNLFNLSGAGVIKFATMVPLGYAFAPGFSYTSPFAGTYAPFRTNFYTRDSDGTPTGYYYYIGDPLIPGSPDTLSALATTAPVPEPASVALLGAGLGLLVFVRRRKPAR